MRTRSTRSWLALLACLAVALTGCANNGGATTSSDKSGSGQTEKSPLEEYLGDSPFARAGKGGGPAMVIKVGGEDEDSEASRAKQRQVEDLIAKCMREQGFTYIPVQPSTGRKSAMDEAYELPPDKFAEQYGYGITTLGWVKDPNANEDSSDPNRQIRDNLSDQAKKAYDKALEGEMGGAVVVSGDSGEVVEQKSTDKQKGDIGCRGKAIEQVHGRPDKDAISNQMDRYESLFEDIEALRKRIDNDPRLEKARKAWSDCMADKNYRFTKPDEAVQSVHDKLQQVFRPLEGEGSANVTEAKKPDPKKIAEIKPYELAVAKADYECSEKHYNKTYREVQFELEKAFVKDHKTELERYRDFMSELRSPTPTPSKGSK